MQNGEWTHRRWPAAILHLPCSILRIRFSILHLLSSILHFPSSILRLQLALLVVTGLAASAWAAAIPPAEKLLPADTVLTITVPDCARLRALLDKSPQSQFWRDPAMKPFHDKFIAKCNEQLVTPLERELGVKLDDYASLPQGLLTLAITQEGWDGQDDHPLGLLFLLDAKDKQSLLRKDLAELRQKWRDAGKPLRSEKIRNVEFSVCPLASNSVPQALAKFFPRHQPIRELGRESEAEKEPARSELVIGQVESLLIIGSSVRTVEKVVAHLTGGAAPALAEQAAFQANALPMFRDAPLYAWFNARAVFSALAALPPEKPNPQAPNPLPTIPVSQGLSALGLTGLKSVAFDLRDAPDGALFELYLGVPESARQGLFKMFAPVPKEAAPPAFVPANVVKFSRWRIDGPTAWDALMKMFEDASPEALSAWNLVINTANAAAQEKDPAYDIKKDFVGNLGDDFISYQRAPRGDSPAQVQSPPTLFLLGSPNADQLLLALKGPMNIVSAQALNPEARDFLGRKIYSVTLANLPLLNAPAGPRTLSYSAGSGYVAISTDVPMLEEFLRGTDTGSKSLRDTPGLADAIQKVGGPGTGWFGYENRVETLRLAFENLRKTPAPATNSGMLAPLTDTIPYARPQESFRTWFDFSLLPPFDRVAKYFSYTVSSGTANVDGLTFKLYFPTPPQLRK